MTNTAQKKTEGPFDHLCNCGRGMYGAGHAESCPKQKIPAHTPGPWDNSGPPLNIYAANGACIAVARDTSVSNKDAQANARLIAAAPKMYAALREIDAHCLQAETVRRIARAALAAAVQS